MSCRKTNWAINPFKQSPCNEGSKNAGRSLHYLPRRVQIYWMYKQSSGGDLIKNVFLEISENSQENTYANRKTPVPESLF